MNDDFDIEKALRASLAEHAKHAPAGDALAEQILAAADRPRPVSAIRTVAGHAGGGLGRCR